MTDLSTVTITGRWPVIDQTPATGTVVITPVTEATGGGVIVAAASLSVPLVDGAIAAVVVNNTQLTTLQYQITEQIDGSPSLTYVVTPSGSTLDLSTAPRGVGPTPIPVYVLASTVGQPDGPATLGSDGILTEAQRPPSETTTPPGADAGLLDATLLTPYSGSGAITLAAGFYENLIFNCDVLIIPHDYTVLRNCRILASGADYGVRLDANTGMEVGRVLEFCEITSTGPALAGAGFTAKYVLVSGNGDDFARIGRSHAEETVLEECWAKDFRPRASAHADGVQVVTQPAADVIIRRCRLSMNTAPGYNIPDDAGYTAAVFVAYDVAIGGGDPNPDRFGKIYVEDSWLSSTDNYSLVVDDNGVIVSNCQIAAGTTGTESINDRGDTVTVVRGHGNTDFDGVPLVTAIHGDDRSDYLTVGDPRQSGVDMLGELTDVDLAGASVNQVLSLSGSGKWSPMTVSGGGGGGGIVAATSEWITSGNISFPNTSGGWSIMQRNAGGNVELQLAASVGDWVGVGYNGLRNNSLPIDVGVVVNRSGVDTIVRWMGNGLGTAPNDGDVGWYTAGPPFIGVSSPRKFHAQSGDIDPAVGAVRFCVVCKGDGSGVLTASADDSFHWWAENLG